MKGALSLFILIVLLVCSFSSTYGQQDGKIDIKMNSLFYPRAGILLNRLVADVTYATPGSKYDTFKQDISLPKAYKGIFNSTYFHGLYQASQGLSYRLQTDHSKFKSSQNEDFTLKEKNSAPRTLTATTVHYGEPVTGPIKPEDKIMMGLSYIADANTKTPHEFEVGDLEAPVVGDGSLLFDTGEMTFSEKTNKGQSVKAKLTLSKNAVPADLMSLYLMVVGERKWVDETDKLPKAVINGVEYDVEIKNDETLFIDLTSGEKHIEGTVLNIEFTNLYLSLDDSVFAAFLWESSNDKFEELRNIVISGVHTSGKGSPVLVVIVVLVLSIAVIGAIIYGVRHVMAKRQRQREAAGGNLDTGLPDDQYGLLE